MKKDIRPILICKTCGFVQLCVQKEDDIGNNYLKCIDFKGPEKILPIGQTNTGFLDCQGRSWSREDFLLRYGVDPKIYIQWRSANKPKPAERCEISH